MTCWNSYWALTKQPDFKQKMKDIVMKDDFLKDNFLCERIPRAGDAAPDQCMQSAGNQRDPQ